MVEVVLSSEGRENETCASLGVALARVPAGAAAAPGTVLVTEVEVVRLAVEGLNNPEIGARLYMSRSTVKTHLSHVFAKVGVANRTELAAAAPAALLGERAR